MLSKFIILIHLLVFMKINKIETQEMPDPEKSDLGHIFLDWYILGIALLRGEEEQDFNLKITIVCCSKKKRVPQYNLKDVMIFSSIPLGRVLTCRYYILLRKLTLKGKSVNLPV